MKKYRIIIIFLVTLSTQHAVAQLSNPQSELMPKQLPDTVTGWYSGGASSIMINQISFTNWATGGVNSVSLTGFLDLYANFRDSLLMWDNKVSLGYGIIRQGDNASWYKNDDRIDIATKVGRYLIKNWFVAGLLNIKSQFAPGYENPTSERKVSDFLAPGYIVAALGFDYKPDKIFSVFLSPISSKTTMVLDTALANNGAYGVTPAVIDNNGIKISQGQMIRNELGGYLKISLNMDIMENISLMTKLDLFSNYIVNYQVLDVVFDGAIVMKVNEYITANLSINLIYDEDIAIPVDRDDDGIDDGTGPRTQLKQLFGAGLSFKF